MALPHRLWEAAREGQCLAEENAPDRKSAELGSDGGSATSWLCICDDWNVCAPTPKFTCGNPTYPCHSVRRRVLWEVMGSWGCSPPDGIHGIIKGAPESPLPSPCEDTSHLPETRPGSHQNRIRLAPWSHTFSLRKCEKSSLLFISHPVPLRRPQWRQGPWEGTNWASVSLSVKWCSGYQSCYAQKVKVTDMVDVKMPFIGGVINTVKANRSTTTRINVNRSYKYNMEWKKLQKNT